MNELKRFLQSMIVKKKFEQRRRIEKKNLTKNHKRRANANVQISKNNHEKNKKKIKFMNLLSLSLRYLFELILIFSI